MFGDESFPESCLGCRNYHGKTYAGNRLICGFHPYGWSAESDGGKCPDWEFYGVVEADPTHYDLVDQPGLRITLVLDDRTAQKIRTANAVLSGLGGAFGRAGYEAVQAVARSVQTVFVRASTQEIPATVLTQIERLAEQVRTTPNLTQAELNQVAEQLLHTSEPSESDLNPADPYQEAIDYLRHHHKLKHGVAIIRFRACLKRYNLTELEAYRLLIRKEISYAYGVLSPKKGALAKLKRSDRAHDRQHPAYRQKRQYPHT